MGNIIIARNLLTNADVTITGTQDDSYPRTNTMVLDNLGRRFQRDDTDANVTILWYDFGSATKLDGVALFDFNFDEFLIAGDSAGSAPWDYTSGSLTPVLNKQTRRLNHFIDLRTTDFNSTGYQYLGIAVPAGVALYSSFSSDSAWRLGSIAIIPDDGIIELAVNMSYGYEREAPQAYTKIGLDCGGYRIVKLGDKKVWEGFLPFNSARTETQEEELWNVNGIDVEPIVYYENSGDEEICCLGFIDGSYRGSIVANGVTVGNIIKIQEFG